MLLALIYVPAYMRLRGVGKRLLDKICPEPPRSADPSAKPAGLLKEYAECRKRVETTMGLDVSAAESFRTAAFLSSPGRSAGLVAGRAAARVTAGTPVRP